MDDISPDCEATAVFIADDCKVHIVVRNPPDADYWNVACCGHSVSADPMESRGPFIFDCADLCADCFQHVVPHIREVARD